MKVTGKKPLAHHRTASLVGQRFGRWTLVDRMPPSNRPAYACDCDCGRSAVVRLDTLLSGLSRSCGCFKLEKARRLDAMVGMKLGRWTVVRPVDTRLGRRYLAVVCECGWKASVRADHLRDGTSIPCWCSAQNGDKNHE
jgi:hypothetical protein